MNDILNLLITYWKPIVGLLFTIAGFVIALIKKAPINDILTDIYCWSLQAVNYAEALDFSDGIKGDSKLQAALIFVFNRMKDKYPTINVERYSKMIQQVIENILQTPQKKD